MVTIAHRRADRGADFYPSSDEVVWGLLAAEAEHLPAVLWEPACGNGALVTPLRALGRTVIATDLFERGCPDAADRIDFLMERQAPAGVTGIVTNPPFGTAAFDFVEHALELVPYVAMFLRLGFLDGVPGLVHILIGCQNSFAKYAKMRAFRADTD